MEYSFFNYFYLKKYSLIIFIINIKDIIGCFDFIDRILFIILIDILLDLCLFVYNYIFYRLCILFSYIKKILNPLGKKISLDITYNKEKSYINKKRIMPDRPRCRFSILGKKNINSLRSITSTIISKGPY